MGLYARVAEGGWLGIALPKEYGGGGRGISDAAVDAPRGRGRGAAITAAPPAPHLFGLNPVVKFGSDRLKGRSSPACRGRRPPRCVRRDQADAGTDTGRITTRRSPTARAAGASPAARSGPARHSSPRSSCSRPHRRQGQRPAGLSCSSPTSIPTTSTSAPSPKSVATRWRRARSRTTASPSSLATLGTENNGFPLLLHGLNAERVLLASEACGIGEVALDRAITYAKERIVFDGPSERTRRSAIRSPGPYPAPRRHG